MLKKTNVEVKVLLLKDFLMLEFGGSTLIQFNGFKLS